MDKIITKSSSINDVLRSYPETIKVFEKHNMGCSGCLGASAETIENGAMMHGIDSSLIVEEINKQIAASHMANCDESPA